MPMYISEQQFWNLRKDTNAGLDYLYSLRDKYATDPDMAAVMAGNPLGEMAGLPYIKQKAEKAARFQYDLSDAWFKPVEQQTASEWGEVQSGRLGEMFVDPIIGLVNPEYTRKKRMRYFKDLMDQFDGATAYKDKVEIMGQMRGADPFTFNQFGAWSSNVAQVLTTYVGAIGAIAKGTKFLKSFSVAAKESEALAQGVAKNTADAIIQEGAEAIAKKGGTQAEIDTFSEIVTGTQAEAHAAIVGGKPVTEEALSQVVKQKMEASGLKNAGGGMASKVAKFIWNGEQGVADAERLFSTVSAPIMANFAMNAYDDIKDEGIKGLLKAAKEDPMGAFLDAALVAGGLRFGYMGVKNFKNKLYEKKIAGKISDKLEGIDAIGLSELDGKYPEPYFNVGDEAVKATSISELKPVLEELRQKAVSANDNVKIGAIDKISETLEYTRRKYTVDDIKKIIDNDAWTVEKARGLTQNTEVLRALDPNKKGYVGTLRSVAKFVSDIMDDASKLEQKYFLDNFENSDKLYKSIIEKAIDEVANGDPSKINWAQVLDHIENSKHDIASYMLGRTPDIFGFAEGFKNMDAAEKTAMKNRVADKGADILSEAEAKAVVEQAGAEEVLKAKKNTKGAVGLQINNLAPQIWDNIFDQFWHKYDQRLGTKSEGIKNLLKNEIEETFNNYFRGGDPNRLVGELSKYVSRFFNDQVEIFGLNATQWERLISKMKSGELTKFDVEKMIRIQELKGIDLTTRLKSESDKSLAPVVKAYSQLYTFLNDNTLKGKSYAKIAEATLRSMEFEKMGNVVNETTRAIKDAWDKYIKQETDAEILDASYFKKVAEDRFKVSWGDEGNKKIMDFTDKNTYTSVLKDILRMEGYRKEGLEGKDLLKKMYEDKQEGKSYLEDYMKYSIENVNKSALTFVDMLGKTDGEVMSKVGLDIIPKLYNAFELHFGSVIETHNQILERADKKIADWRKSGEKIDIAQITDWLEDGNIQLTPHERAVGQALRQISDYWKELKDIYPDFTEVKEYLPHDISGIYLNAETLFKNEWGEKFSAGIKKTDDLGKEYARASEKLQKVKENDKIKPELKALEIEKLENKLQRLSKTMATFQQLRTDIRSMAQYEIDRAYKGYNDGTKDVPPRIDKYTYERAMSELNDKVFNPDGEIKGDVLTKVLRDSPDLPDYIKQRIEYGGDPTTDFANKYFDDMLRDKGIRLDVKAIDPTSIVHYITREVMRLRGEKGGMPSWMNAEKIRGALEEFGGLGEKSKADIIRSIVDADHNYRATGTTRMKEVWDVSTIKRVGNAIYKAGNPLEIFHRYLKITEDGLKLTPMAKIMNVVMDKSVKAPEATRAYLRNKVLDIMGRDRKFDTDIKNIISKPGNWMELMGDAMIKKSANDRGMKNVKIINEGEHKIVIGDQFDVASGKQFTGLKYTVDEVLPPRIGGKMVDGVKGLQYASSIGLSVSSTILNMLQPIVAFAFAPHREGFWKTMSSIGKAYGEAFKIFTDKEKMNEIKRARAFGQYLDLTTAEFGSKRTGWGKVMEFCLANMTMTEYLNRTATMEYFKQTHAGEARAAGFNEAMVTYLARDFSDKFNFRFDEISQVPVMRSYAGKILFHLGSFALKQGKLVIPAMIKGIKSLPAAGRAVKSALKAFGEGDSKRMWGIINQMNNDQRFAFWRYTMASCAAYGMYGSLMGYAPSSILVNRTVAFSPTNNPLINSGEALVMLFNGEGDPRANLLAIAKSYVPAGTQLNKLWKALEENDMRYVLSNSRDIWDFGPFKETKGLIAQTVEEITDNE